VLKFNHSVAKIHHFSPFFHVRVAHVDEAVVTGNVKDGLEQDVCVERGGG